MKYWAISMFLVLAACFPQGDPAANRAELRSIFIAELTGQDDVPVSKRDEYAECLVAALSDEEVAQVLAASTDDEKEAVMARAQNEDALTLCIIELTL